MVDVVDVPIETSLKQFLPKLQPEIQRHIAVIRQLNLSLPKPTQYTLSCVSYLGIIELRTRRNGYCITLSDFPSKLHSDGNYYHYNGSVASRSGDLPAKYATGGMTYFKDSKLHRFIGPGRKISGCMEIWIRDDIEHRYKYFSYSNTTCVSYMTQMAKHHVSVR